MRIYQYSPKIREIDKMLNSKIMTKKYVLANIQVEKIKHDLIIIKLYSLKPGFENKIDDIIDYINQLMDKQLIGESRETIDNDVNDLRNLFASWCL